MSSRANHSYKLFLVGAFFLTFFTILFYLVIRIALFVMADYLWYEKILALLLLLAEGFILIHSLGYFVNVFIVHKHLLTAQDKISNLQHYPPIAIIVASYKEPLSVIQDTLICFYNISYPNKHLYFLDDTRYDLPWDTPENKEKYRHEIEKLCQWLGVNLFRSKWHGAKAGKINDFLQFLAGNIKPGFEINLYGEPGEKKEREKYLIIFDADMNPIPNFAEELVAIMEKKSHVAFIQTPQYYTNFETNRVARAAGVQQAIFYEYICEGKSLKDAMFCCGTNVLFRIEALMSVGGFDENSVTEDFATSVRLHQKGWGSVYLNKVLAFGMGPEDLGAYFKQQFRWATGTIGILRMLFLEIWRNFRKFTLSQWWEYFLASTHYLVGWVFLVMILSPICYLLFNAPSYFARPEMYFLAYTPYIVISTFMFFWTITQRKYRPVDLVPALLINAVAFPVFIKASFFALLGIKTSFGITPKGGAHALSFRSLVPQLIATLLCTFALTWGFLRLYYEQQPFYAILFNMFWTFYNFMTVSFFIYFNHSEEPSKT